MLLDTRGSGWIAGCLLQFLVHDRVPLPLMVPGNFSWTLMRVALLIETLDQKQCFGRLYLQSLRGLGSRLGMPRLALKALEAHGQLERYLFIDGQPTSMLIRGGELRRVPQGCALPVHFCNLAGWAWNVCMKRGTPARPYQRLL